MSATRDFDDIARAWLDLMPSDVPDRAVDAVLDAVAVTPQARPRAVGFWRIPKMARFAFAGGVVAVAVIAGALALVPRSKSDVAAPSTSASPSAGSTGAALDDALRATWVAWQNEDATLGTGAGPVRLVISSVGTGIDAQNFGPGHGYASTAVQVGSNRIELALDRDGGGCTRGDRGVYEATLKENQSYLVFHEVSDDCANRALIFGRTWIRSLDDPSNVGAGAVTALDPDFSIAMPQDTYQTRHLEDFVEVGGATYSLMVHKNPQPFVDPCSTAEERVPYEPGAAAFIDFFKGNDAYEVTGVSTLTIDGHPAMHAVVAGKSSYARCPGQALYEYTPRNCGCHFVVGPGGSDSMYLVEVGADTFLFILSPVGTATEREVMDSIKIPFTLPGG